MYYNLKDWDYLPRRRFITDSGENISMKSNYDKTIKNRANNNHKIFTITVFAALSIYLLGYLVLFLSKPSISIETVSYGSVDVPATLRGIIVRDETIVVSEMSGEPAYNYSEYDKVPDNAVVCVVKDIGAAQVIEKEIQKLDENIIAIQRNRADFSIFKEDIQRLQDNIANIVDNNIYKMNGDNISIMYSMKDQIEAQIQMRNQIWLTENTKNTTSLTDEKTQYENQLLDYKQVVRAKNGGIVSLHVDNLEEIVTIETLQDITREQINMDVQQKYISKTMSVSEGATLFRLVHSNTWYIVSYVPNEVASQWNEGDYMEIYATANDEEKYSTVQIQSMKKMETDTYTVFVTDRNLIDFMDLRTMEFKVKENIYEGFKIPNDAIVEKTFIKIPKEFVVTSLENDGVIKRNASGDSFISIKIAQSNADNVFILQDFGALKVGDTIVAQGEDAQTYILNEVVTYKGVYVVNSSIARFTVIDIIGQNVDYTIINPDNRYGLKIYDKIVSNAKTVENEEAVS